MQFGLWVMRMITLAALILTAAHAHEFPAQQVEYVCATASFYVTTPSDSCIMQQYHWFVEASQSEHYESNLIYGQRHNYRGEVVGIDFKLVLDRVRWLSR